MKIRISRPALRILVAPSSAISAETITYTHNSKGQMVKTVRTGAVNNGTVEYEHDKAEDRTRHGDLVLQRVVRSSGISGLIGNSQ